MKNYTINSQSEKMDTVTVIGLGEIGEKILRSISKKCNAYGYDTNREKTQKLAREGLRTGNKIQKAGKYIIAVYHSKDVVEVIKSLEFGNNPLVIIESTVEPGTVRKIKEFKQKNKLQFNLALFPHRHNPNDAEHQLFNLDRIVGGLTKECTEKVTAFYSKFMDRKKMHEFPIEIVEIAKPLENAYRFLEIAFAEELKMLCEKKKIDFKQLRKAMNTKWNIGIREARQGIKGKCLEKDAKISTACFKDNTLLKTAMRADKKYKDFLQTQAQLLGEKSLEIMAGKKCRQEAE